MQLYIKFDKCNIGYVLSLTFSFCLFKITHDLQYHLYHLLCYIKSQAYTLNIFYLSTLHCSSKTISCYGCKLIMYMTRPGKTSYHMWQCLRLFLNTTAWNIINASHHIGYILYSVFTKLSKIMHERLFFSLIYLLFVCFLLSSFFSLFVEINLKPHCQEFPLQWMSIVFMAWVNFA